MLLSSDFFQDMSKYQAVFSKIKRFLHYDKLTFSISQKSGGQVPPPPLPPHPPVLTPLRIDRIKFNKSLNIRLSQGLGVLGLLRSHTLGVFFVVGPTGSVELLGKCCAYCPTTPDRVSS